MEGGGTSCPLGSIRHVITKFTHITIILRIRVRVRIRARVRVRVRVRVRIRVRIRVRVSLWMMRSAVTEILIQNLLRLKESQRLSSWSGTGISSGTGFVIEIAFCGRGLV